MAYKATVNTSNVSLSLATKHVTVAAERGNGMPRTMALTCSLKGSWLRMYPEARSVMLNI